MGTKNNPGKFDCYANAEPDEPMFVLLGRDKHAPALVTLWAAMRDADGEDEAKVHEAIECALAMAAYLQTKGKEETDLSEFVACGACAVASAIKRIGIVGEPRVRNAEQGAISSETGKLKIEGNCKITAEE